MAPKHLLLARLRRYYRSRGLVHTLKRIAEKAYETLLPDPYVLFLIDFKTLDPIQVEIPDNTQVLVVSSEEELLPTDREILDQQLGAPIISHKLGERFPLGARMWLIRVDDALTGFVWSIRGATVQAHFFPLSESEVHVFDDFIFESSRGRGINRHLLRYVIGRLQAEGASRLHVETVVDNIAERRSLAKTPFRPYAIARKRKMFGKIRVAWSPGPPE